MEGRSFEVGALRRLHIYADVLLVCAAWLGAWGTRRLLDPALGVPINGIEIYAATAPVVVGA